jgi:hypothetical protein
LELEVNINSRYSLFVRFNVRSHHKFFVNGHALLDRDGAISAHGNGLTFELGENALLVDFQNFKCIKHGILPIPRSKFRSRPTSSISLQNK